MTSMILKMPKNTGMNIIKTEQLQTFVNDFRKAVKKADSAFFLFVLNVRSVAVAVAFADVTL